MLVHWLVDGHATLSSVGPPRTISTGVGVPGAVGLNVTCRPSSSTAVHWLVDGHATPVSQWPASIVVGVGVPGAVGLNVTCLPSRSTAVHWLADGHATPRQFVAGVDRGRGGGARRSRVERHLLADSTDSGALAGRRARDIHEIGRPAGLIQHDRRRPQHRSHTRHRNRGRRTGQLGILLSAFNNVISGRHCAHLCGGNHQHEGCGAGEDSSEPEHDDPPVIAAATEGDNRLSSSVRPRNGAPM